MSGRPKIGKEDVGVPLVTGEGCRGTPREEGRMSGYRETPSEGGRMSGHPKIGGGGWNVPGSCAFLPTYYSTVLQV